MGKTSIRYCKKQFKSSQLAFSGGRASFYQLNGQHRYLTTMIRKKLNLKNNDPRI